jgi:hypothetical protein
MSDLAAQHVTDPPDAQKNYLVVDHKTETHTIEEAFDSFTQERKDIAIVLINQHVRPPLYTSPSFFSPWRTLIPLADCRQDPQSRRCLHPSFPLAPRDPFKGPPLRPRKGQRHEARQEVVWRVNPAAVSHVQRYPEYKSYHHLFILQCSNATCARISRPAIIHCLNASFHDT